MGATSLKCWRRDLAIASCWKVSGQHVAKTATIVDDSSDDPCAIFEPPRFDDQAIVKFAVEPLNPAELPKMTEGLRKISKSYPLARTKVEESGELYLDVVVGTGSCTSIARCTTSARCTRPSRSKSPIRSSPSARP